MRVLYIDYEHYLFPEGINSLEEFIDHVNRHINSFIPLVHLLLDNCIEPYFIREDTRIEYLNFASISIITEKDAEVITRKEYDSRLKQLVLTTCINCVHFKNTEPLVDEGTREKLCLDGKCHWFEEKE